MSKFVSFGSGRYRQMDLEYGDQVNISFSNDGPDERNKGKVGKVKECGCQGDWCHHDSWKKKQQTSSSIDLSQTCQWCGKTRAQHSGQSHTFSPYSSGNAAENTKILQQ